jgi:hypothetical protein
MGTRADPRWPAALACTGLALVLGWFAFVRETRVPLLGWCDLGVHEFGHFFFMALRAPELVVAMMGNGLQTFVPLALAVVLAVARGDWPAAGLCLAWAGTTLQDASVYIADAPFQRLPLFIPGTEHDWGLALGPEMLDILDRSGEIAKAVHHAGVVALAAGLCLCLVPAALRQVEAAPTSR